MQRAIVTGGSRGIGLAIARALMADGAHVTITGRNPEHLARAAADLADAFSGNRVKTVKLDARDRAGVEALVRDTVDALGGLDVLVNNAGVGVFEPAEALTDEDWSGVIDTNLTGVFYATRAAIPAMRRTGGGWIVNIASLASRNNFPGGAAYCASKAGLLAFSECVMQEVRHDDIRVSVIMPGSVATEFSGRGAADGEDWRLAPEDVAEAVMSLLRHPARSLPSRIEIRPARPKKR